MRESVCEQGGAEREEDTESKTGPRLWAVSKEPDVGLEPTNPEPKWDAELTEPPRHPNSYLNGYKCDFSRLLTYGCMTAYWDFLQKFCEIIQLI